MANHIITKLVNLEGPKYVHHTPLWITRLVLIAVGFFLFIGLYWLHGIYLAAGWHWSYWIVIVFCLPFLWVVIKPENWGRWITFIVNNSGIFIKGKSRKGYLFLPWSNIGKIGAGRFQIPGQTQFTSGISVPLKKTNSEWKFIAGIRKKEMEGEFARFIVSGHSRNIEEVLERINLFRNNMA